MNTIADLAWAAGIIDGEGSIFVMKQRRKDRERDCNYILRVSVESTDPYMTKELGNIFPDGAEFSQKSDKRENNSDTRKFQVNGRKASALLKEVLPFLRVKTQQAILGISFQETTKKHWKQMEEKDYLEQEAFYLKLKQAKQDLKIGKPTNLREESNSAPANQKDIVCS